MESPHIDPAQRMRDLLKDATLEIRRLRARVGELESAPPAAPQDAIAIVGMGCRLPGGVRTPDDFWALLRDGVDAMADVPPRSWDIDRHYDADRHRAGHMYVRQGGFIDEVESFDPQFFGISPREAEAMDPQQRLLLEVGFEALEHAGIPVDRLRGSATGVHVGLCFDDYASRVVRSGDLGRIDAHGALGNNRAIAAGRIAYTFGFQGPVLQLDTTCSSSLLALHLACRSLRDREADLMLAGGVNLMLSPEVSVGFSRLQALSPDGRCRTFDAAASGYARGEGCVMVVLKRLSDALADGDTVWALVRGSAVNHDGASNGLTAPNGEAQAAVIRAALAAGGLRPDDVQYVEAHGTATPLGDPIEALALAEAYGPRSAPLTVASVKTNFGHLESAAGVAGLMKAVLAIHHRRIPPHLHFATPSPRIPWSRLPLHVPRELEAWPQADRPLRAGISSFGMSGTNVHVIVEQPPATATTEAVLPARRWQVLPLSARGDEALRALCDAHADALATDADIAARCAGVALRRAAHAHRRALVACDAAGLRAALLQAVRDPLPAPVRAAPRIAFLFSGQGAQYAGMGAALYRDEPVFRAAIDRCAEVLDPLLPQPLAGLLQPDAGIAIDRTINTQPALFAFQYALTELWASWGVRPQIVLGHSIGEYAAAVAAGTMSLPQALRLIAMRARLMDGIPADGAMVAVRAGRERVRALLPEGVDIAACNAPSQTVIAGLRARVLEAVQGLEAAGLSCVHLPVSQAFHSALMDPLLGAFASHAAAVDFALPRCSWISSVTGAVESEATARADYWVEQIRRPVEFSAALDVLVERCDLALEIGPQPVLVALAAQRDDAARVRWLSSLPRRDGGDGGDDMQGLMRALAALFEAGVDPDWRGLLAQRPQRPSVLPPTPMQRRRCWIDAVPAQPSVAAGDWPGRLLPIAGGDLHVLATKIDANDARWADHAVAGTPLWPAAAYLCAALHAAQQAGLSRVALAGMRIREALWLDGMREVQTRLLRDAGTGDGRWSVHCGDRLHAEGLFAAGADLSPALHEAAAAVTSADDFYARYAARGIVYGASYRLLTDIRIAADQASATLCAGAVGSSLAEPAVIDAGLQLAGALFAERDGRWLPRAVAGFQWPGGAVVAVRARRAQAEGDAPCADIQWLDADGRVCGHLRGLELAAAGTATGRSEDGPAQPATSAWRIEWVEQTAPAWAAGWRDAVNACLQALPLHADVIAHREAEPLLDALACALAADALRRVDAAALPDERRALYRRMQRLAEAASGVDAAALHAGLIAAHPAVATEAELVMRAGRGLAEVLNGRADPLELLFPGGDLSLLTRLYESSPGARAMNGLLRDALHALVAGWPADRPLRVLEIGAGTGGTTAHLLPMLRDSGCAVHYRYTDVSAHFLNVARARFAGFDFVEYGLLDIERPPAPDDAGGFDLVLAANVLHATADMARTLSHVHALLAPGGCLLVLEATRPLAWLDVVFGLMPGWWAFRDHALRPDHPLLDDARWQALLHAQGYAPVQLLQPATPLSQSVIVAHRAARTQRWAVADLGDAARGEAARGEAALAARLSDALAAAGDRIVGEGFSHRLCVLPVADGPAALDGQLRALLAEVRAAVACGEPPRLVLAMLDSADGALVASACWGLLQTVALEHPELRPRLVRADTLDALVRALREDDAEPHVWMEAGRRKVARLVEQAAAPRRLRIDEARTLDGLHWAVQPTPAPAAGEVLLRVDASALNFRDVLVAMGEYPGAADIGAECAGTVLAVGDGVTQCRPGQRVMALGEGLHAERACVDARLVRPLPAGLTAVQAATLPVAYVTAWAGLVELASLRAGERVLVLAASGGVGMAAIAVARQIGAEVWACASRDKHALLRDMGIARVFDSRDPDFGRAVLDASGGEGVDVVFGAARGDGLHAAIAALDGGGRFVDIGKAGRPGGDALDRLPPGIALFRFDLSDRARREPQRVGDWLQRVHDSVVAGHWPTLPHQVFAPGDAPSAFQRMQQSRHTGKLVLTGADRPRFDADAAYLLTGGFGALGLLTAEWMAERGARHLHLLGRHVDADLPALARLREAGVTLDLHAADVADFDALAAVFARIDASGRTLRGVVHAAGVLDDALIARMDDAALSRALAPKVAGGWHLHRLSAGRPLDFFVLYASAAGVIGAPGQVNHAAANAFLDGLARSRRAHGLPALSVAWGAWSDVGSALKYQEGTRTHATVSGLPGVGVMAPGEGLDWLDRLWSSADADVAVLSMDWPRFTAQPRLAGMRLFPRALRAARSDARDSAPGAPLHESFAALDAEARTRAIDDFVTAAVAGTLGLQAAELDRQTGFFDLGMDSLTALELKNRLQRELGIALSNTLIFDHPTTAALVAHLQQALAPADVARIAEADLGDALDARLDALDALLGDDGDAR